MRLNYPLTPACGNGYSVFQRKCTTPQLMRLNYPLTPACGNGYSVFQRNCTMQSTCKTILLVANQPLVLDLLEILWIGGYQGCLWNATEYRKMTQLLYAQMLCNCIVTTKQWNQVSILWKMWNCNRNSYKQLRSLQLLLPKCICFSHCSPNASTSAVAPQLRPFQLLLPDCICFSHCSPAVSALAAAPWLCPLVIMHTQYKVFKYEGRASRSSPTPRTHTTKILI